MAKRTGWLGRGLAVAPVGVVLGLGGTVGESVAQDSMKKSDTMKMDDQTKAGDTVPSTGSMKSSDTMMGDHTKGDMKDDKMMEKKQ